MNHKFRISALLIILFAVLSIAPPAHAVSKEIIELQTQVQQLLDMVQRIQSTVDTRFGLIQHLVEQATDSSNQMTTAVNTLQQKINAQNEAFGGKMEAASGQVQALNDSVDELKAQITKLNKSIQDLQGQLQNIQSQPAPVAAIQSPSLPASSAAATAPLASAAAQSSAPPLQETLQAGMRDYNAARYEIASGEFSDVSHYYPQDELAGVAQFYLGEIAYRQSRFSDAVKAYTIVLEQFNGTPNAVTAQLHKGLALLQLKKREAGVRELRQVVIRHPQSPEAGKARAKLNEIGERINSSR